MVNKVDGLLTPEFDAATHSYRLNGRHAPGVTTVLNSALGVNPFWTKEGRDAGQATHSAIHFYAQNDLDYETLDEATKPRLDAYIKFCADQKFKPDLIETPLCHRTLLYCGTPDQIQIGRVVVDFKNGAHLPQHAFQLAAYANMLPNPYSYDRWCVQLLPNGTYKLESHRKTEFTNDLNMFMSCLNIHNWRKLHGGGTEAVKQR